MPQQGYSIGRDLTLALILPDGRALRFGKITKWDAKPDQTDQKITAIGGDTDHLRFYQGWSGSFDIERRSGDLDAYFAEAERLYHAGVDEGVATLQQTIVEPNGQVSQFRFERVLLRYDDAGEWSGDKSVSQKVSFMASRRIKQG